jgi:hypothetical protein
MGEGSRGGESERKASESEASWREWDVGEATIGGGEMQQRERHPENERREGKLQNADADATSARAATVPHFASF